MAIHDKTKAPSAHDIIASAINSNGVSVKKNRYKAETYNRPPVFKIGERIYVAPTDNKAPADIPAIWVALPPVAEYRGRVVFYTDSDID